MRTLERDKRNIKYCKYINTVDLVDINGFITGEKQILYSSSVDLNVNISSAKGEVQIENFGTVLNYDRVILIDDINLNINEKDLFFIDKEPFFNGKILTNKDYVIIEISKTPNILAITIAKVK